MTFALSTFLSIWRCHPARFLSFILILFTLISSPVHSSSVHRNPLLSVSALRKPSIETPSNRISAFSSFDLSFLLDGKSIHLRLEPNHHILAHDATVHFLDSTGGHIKHSEPFNRASYKVFKGSTWISGQNVGSARIFVINDGPKPLFEGVFDILRDNHHIMLDKNYISTRHPLDPPIPLNPSGKKDPYMIAFRDSDIFADNTPHHHELRRSLILDDSLDFVSAENFNYSKKFSTPTCLSDFLESNVRVDNPVNSYLLESASIPKLRKRLWSSSVDTYLAKRQLGTFRSVGSVDSPGINLLETIGQTAGCPNTRKIALVGVATDCTYTSTFNSNEEVRAKIISIMNSASDLYERTFNVSLGLRNLTISDANCPASPPPATPWNVPCSKPFKIQDRLDFFSAWRGSFKDTNSHWTLLTNCSSDSAVGLAWLGQLCVDTVTVSNVTRGLEVVSGANVVAKTSTEWQVLAHEIAHTFGAVHDCTAESCSSEGKSPSVTCCPLSAQKCNARQQYIMNPTTAGGITEFSPCSIGNICAVLGSNKVMSSCLLNNRGVPTITGQQCGNGIVEEGEECDCGGVEGCRNNSCCDPGTCKFKGNSVCDDSNEDCCRNCQFASSNTVCRKSTGECDLEEKCTGNSSVCPSDRTKPDGSSCSNGLKCASGQCTSRNLQCKTLMSAYTNDNNTSACDTTDCVLSCASSEFGRGICYRLQQNFLDGTECGGGGHCVNGQCHGSNLGKELTSWFRRHQTVALGVGVTVGLFVVLLALSCISRCFLRNRANQSDIKNAHFWPPYNGYDGPVPTSEATRHFQFPGGNQRASHLARNDQYVYAPAPQQPSLRTGGMMPPPPMYMSN